MTDVRADAAIRLLFFGKVADALGRARAFGIPDGGCTVAELRRLIDAETLGQKGVRASVNRQIVGEDARVRPGDEVAFFSVFSGG